MADTPMAGRPRARLLSASRWRAAAQVAGLWCIVLAAAILAFSPVGPDDGVFWLALMFGFACGISFGVIQSWIVDLGIHQTLGGRALYLAIYIAPVEAFVLWAQDDVGEDAMLDFTVIAGAFLGTAGLIIATGFWKRWLPLADRSTESVPLTVISTLAAVVAITVAFSGLSAVLEAREVIATKPDVEDRAVWKSQTFYAWQFWDSIPELEIPQTLGWEREFKTSDWLGGLLVLLFKLLVILPVVAAITDLWRRGKERSHSAHPRQA